jgi:periplasmic divalent cation tolerance protein
MASAAKKPSQATLIVKTTASLTLKCTERVKSIHSYETPCVLELDVAGGNENYLSWLRNQVL